MSFKYENYYLRLIEEIHSTSFEMFNCGLVDSLIKEGLFPTSKIVEFKGHFAVKHEFAASQFFLTK